MTRQTYKPDEIIALATPIFSRFNVKQVGLFGSYAQDTATPDSDIDFAIEFATTPSLFVLGQLKDDLEATFGKTCDIVTLCSLKQDESKLAREIERGLTIVYD